MSNYLLLKGLRVQNANALSSPFTFGFPAVTAFLGFGHALQRFINPESKEDQFLVAGVGVSSHQFEMQDYQEGYSRMLKLTANPLNEKGERPSFVEEGRCHMVLSLVLEVENVLSGRDQDRLLESIRTVIQHRLKLAGGGILDFDDITVVTDDRTGLMQLMPGYVLLDRRSYMLEAMESGQDALDALYSYLQIHTFSEQDEGGNVHWRSAKSHTGWLVPIASGFHALSALGEAQQTRDLNTPHCFAESIVTLGEFIMPHRLESLSEIIWRYRKQGDLYLCTQEQTVTQENKESTNG